jgi:hypothetical protein
LAPFQNTRLLPEQSLRSRPSGGFLNFNPHCHALCTDGIFYGSGSFKVAPALDTEPLEKIFQHKVLGMLLRKGKIAKEVAKLILSWRHSGFNVYCGSRINACHPVRAVAP